MKILFLTDDFPPQTFGGAGFSTFYLASGMQKAGHQIFVVTTCRNKSDEGNRDWRGLRVFRISANYHERWQAYFSLYNPQTVKKVEKIIRDVNPDIVHAHNIHFYLSYHCLKIAKKLKKPVFFTARDTMLFSYGKILNARISWLDNLKQAKKRYNPLRNFFIKRYLNYADRILAVSMALSGALNQNGIKNTEVSYTGIDVEDWGTSPELVEGFKKKHNLYDKKVVFFGGRISGLKGLEHLNQAMTKVKEKIPEAVLLAAGNGGVGWLLDRELRAAYHSSDVVAVPSVYLDPFPRTNLEAMACHKPVVGTCYGGTPEIVQDGITGFIVNPNNTGLLAEKIIDLLLNPEKARQFGEAGFERVKKYFGLDAHVAETLAWYQKFI